MHCINSLMLINVIESLIVDWVSEHIMSPYTTLTGNHQLGLCIARTQLVAHRKDLHPHHEVSLLPFSDLQCSVHLLFLDMCNH